ncbi:MAG TPA: choice-of-anchor L domain-containing protein [bacterium]|nr:choice-of-anchor L domain-containing protein [bacterium]
MPNRFLFFPIFLFLPLSAGAAGISVTTLGGALSASDLAADLVGAGITVSNVVYTGAPGAAGTFSGASGILDFDGGVVLSTGAAPGIIGPDTGDSSVCWGLPGDSDLSASFGGEVTNDASVLEFDFVPQSAMVAFKYVFGSDEYLYYIGSYNDAFAIYVNGVNVALVPVTNQPVCVNDINPTTNSQYFVCNQVLAPYNYSPACPCDTGMNGFTTGLSASVAVTPGVTNHIKFAIADAIDCALDSWVCIEAQSLAVVGTATPTANPTSTPSRTASRTLSPTRTYSPTRTVSPTPTATPTSGPTRTPTPLLSPTTPAPSNSLSLTAAYPNPDPSQGPVWLPYVLTCDADVEIRVYDVAGETVRDLEPFAGRAGQNEEYWDGRNKFGASVASGVYISHITARADGQTQDAWVKLAITR